MKDRGYSDKLNPLSGYDPDQPRYIPKRFDRAYKRSVYFPRTKAFSLYQVNEFIRESQRAGKRITLNDVLSEALDLWLKEKRTSYLSSLAYRLNNEKATILSRLDLDKLDEHGPSFSNDEVKTRYEQIQRSLEEIESSLKHAVSPWRRFDVKNFTFEIIYSLGKHCSEEMKTALPKILDRSDIAEIAKQVRHEPKIKKIENILTVKKDEEPEWYE
jgi:hypothetical protein